MAKKLKRLTEGEIEMLQLLKAELESRKSLHPPPDSHLAVMEGLHGHLKRLMDAFGVTGACYDTIVAEIIAKARTLSNERPLTVGKYTIEELSSGKLWILITEDGEGLECDAATLEHYLDMFWEKEF